MVRCLEGRLAPDNETFYDAGGNLAYCPESVNFTF